MLIELNPKIEALLKAQVKAGRFRSVEEAITAAVLGVPVLEDALGDLSWARPFIEEAEADIAAGRTYSEDEAYAELERRYGKL